MTVIEFDGVVAGREIDYAARAAKIGPRQIEGAASCLTEGWGGEDFGFGHALTMHGLATLRDLAGALEVDDLFAVFHKLDEQTLRMTLAKAALELAAVGWDYVGDYVVEDE